MTTLTHNINPIWDSAVSAKLQRFYGFVTRKTATNISQDGVKTGALPQKAETHIPSNISCTFTAINV